MPLTRAGDSMRVGYGKRNTSAIAAASVLACSAAAAFESESKRGPHLGHVVPHERTGRIAAHSVREPSWAFDHLADEA